MVTCSANTSLIAQGVSPVNGISSLPGPLSPASFSERSRFPTTHDRKKYKEYREKPLVM
jgi:hypothetical protein